MARYTHCLNCGNEEEGTDLYHCSKCGTYYCKTCAREQNDGLHCPDCEEAQGLFQYIGRISNQSRDDEESGEEIDDQEEDFSNYDSKNCYYCGIDGIGEYHYEDFFHRKCWDEFVNTNRFKEWEKTSKEIEMRKVVEEIKILFEEELEKM